MEVGVGVTVGVEVLVAVGVTVRVGEGWGVLEGDNVGVAGASPGPQEVRMRAINEERNK